MIIPIIKAKTAITIAINTVERNGFDSLDEAGGSTETISKGHVSI
jgi:hypothetical protein